MELTPRAEPTSQPAAMGPHAAIDSPSELPSVTCYYQVGACTPGRSLKWMQKGLQRHDFGWTLNIREIVAMSQKREMCWSSRFNLSHMLWFLKAVAWKSYFSSLEIGGLLLLISQWQTLWPDIWTPWWAAVARAFDASTEICSHTGNRHPVQGGAPQLLLPQKSLKIRNCSRHPTPAVQPPQTGAPRSLEASRKGVSTIHSLWAWDIKIKHFHECVLCPEKRFLGGGWLIQEILILQ